MLRRDASMHSLAYLTGLLEFNRKDIKAMAAGFGKMNV